MNKKVCQNENGYVLVTVLVFFVVIMIFGVSILSFSTSNTRMSIHDSQYQQLAYIAESGNNAFLIDMQQSIATTLNGAHTKEEIFQKFEEKYVGTENKKVINSFDTARPELSATTILEHLSSNTYSRTYSVKTVATNGKSSRIIMDNVTIAPEITNSANPFIYTSKFQFLGTDINGPGETLVTDGIDTLDLNGGSALNISTMYFNSDVRMIGGSASFGSQIEPGAIYVNGKLDLWDGRRNVYGNVHVNGDFRLKDAKIFNDVYVNGDLELGWTPEIHSNIYYTGTLKYPNGNYSQDLLDKCKKVNGVPSFTIPIQNYSLKTDDWYAANGYNSDVIYTSGTLTEHIIPKDAKRLVDNYVSSHHTSPEGNIVIVSKGDITINGWRDITGFLFAPNGTVNLDIANFTGIIISKDGIIWRQGGAHFYAQKLSDIFTNEADYPFNVDTSGGVIDYQKSIKIKKLNKES